MNDPRGTMVGDVERRVILPGMPRDEVVRILGEPDQVLPDGTYTYDIGEWEAVRFVDPFIFFYVEFDASGRVKRAIAAQG